MIIADLTIYSYFRDMVKRAFGHTEEGVWVVETFLEYLDESFKEDKKITTHHLYLALEYTANAFMDRFNRTSEYIDMLEKFIEELLGSSVITFK